MEIARACLCKGSLVGATPLKVDCASSLLVQRRSSFCMLAEIFATHLEHFLGQGPSVISKPTWTPFLNGFSS